jgi:DNA-binding protein Alba
MMKLEGSEERVFIGSKEIKNYISASLFALGKSDKIVLTSRGNNIKRAIDVAAILVRQYLVNPEYDVIIGSEGFEDRNVSTIDIIIKGTRKDNGES